MKVFLKVANSYSDEGWIFLLLGCVTNNIFRIQYNETESQSPIRNIDMQFVILCIAYYLFRIDS